MRAVSCPAPPRPYPVGPPTRSPAPMMAPREQSGEVRPSCVSMRFMSCPAPPRSCPAAGLCPIRVFTPASLRLMTAALILSRIPSSSGGMVCKSSPPSVILTFLRLTAASILARIPSTSRRTVAWSAACRSASALRLLEILSMARRATASFRLSGGTGIPCKSAGEGEI